MSYRLSDLSPEKREHLSTEEIIQIASQLSDGETIYCRTPVTSIITLVIGLNNKTYMWRVDARLEVRNPDHMLRHLDFPFRQSSLQAARVAGRPHHEPRLSVEDVVNIFELGNSVRWRLYGMARTTYGNEAVS